MGDQLKQSAFDFHEFPVPGKIQVLPIKPLAARYDLVLAYSPGVAASCLEIKKDPLEAYKYTAHDNLVAVISNGTTVLGLGDIGVLAGRPVMESKGVLFKKFAGIDVFDIEADKLDPDKLIRVVAALEPVFGGINLKDIKAPECFYIEQKLRERMNIPVLHDDQHGMTIVSTATVLNDLHVVGKNISGMRMVVSSTGTAATACVNLLVALSLQKHNIVVCDSRGAIYQGRKSNMVGTRIAHTVADDGKRTLDDVTEGADILLGCSGPKVLTQRMVKKMAHVPMVLASVNPEPETLSPPAKEVRPDAIICIGRSGYPDQVNNVPYFPFIFRGTSNVDATATNEEMKLAAARMAAELVHAGQSEVVASAHGDQDLSFGPKYTIPKPSDPRLIIKIAPVMVKAAMESGVATCPITDFDVHIDRLTEFVYKTNLFMKPIFSQARKAPGRIALPKGEEACVLYATQELATLGLAEPVLTGRPNVIKVCIQKLDLQIKSGVDFRIINNESGPRFKEYWAEYFQIMKHRSITQEQAQRVLIGSPIVIGTIMIQRNEADAMICGTVGDYHEYFSVVKNVLDYRDGVRTADVMSTLLLSSDSTFIADIHVNDEPDAEGLAEITLMAAETVRHFNIEPRVALLPHSDFGSSDYPLSSKIRQALELIKERAPELMIDGEIHGDAALVEATRSDRMSDSPLKGSANILVTPSMEATRASYNLLCVSSSEGVTIGPVLMGVMKPVHVLTSIASVRRIVNMVVLAVVEAQT